MLAIKKKRRERAAFMGIGILKQHRISRDNKRYSLDQKHNDCQFSQQEVNKIYSDNSCSSSEKHSGRWQEKKMPITEACEKWAYYSRLLEITINKNIKLNSNISRLNESKYLMEECSRKIESLQHENYLGQKKIILMKKQNKRIENKQPTFELTVEQIQQFILQNISFQIDQDFERSIKALQLTLEDKFFEEKAFKNEQRLINRLERFKIQQQLKLTNMQKTTWKCYNKIKTEQRQKERQQISKNKQLLEHRKKQLDEYIQKYYLKYLEPDIVEQIQKMEKQITQEQSKNKALLEQKQKLQQKRQEQRLAINPNSQIIQEITTEIYLLGKKCFQTMRQIKQKKKLLQDKIDVYKTNIYREQKKQFQTEFDKTQKQINNKYQQIYGKARADREENEKARSQAIEQYQMKYQKYQKKLKIYKQSRLYLITKKHWNQNQEDRANQNSIKKLYNQFYGQYSYLQSLYRKSSIQTQRFFRQDDLPNERELLQKRSQQIRQQQERYNLLKEKYQHDKRQIQQLKQLYRINFKKIKYYKARKVSLEIYLNRQIKQLGISNYATIQETITAIMIHE